MKEEEQRGAGWGPWALFFPPHTEVAWSRIGNSLLGRLIGICCPGDKEIICEIMGRGVSHSPEHDEAWGLLVSGGGGGRWRPGPRARPGALKAAVGAPRLHGAGAGAGLGKGKSATVCGITGTKDASVTPKNLLWEQSCRSVIAH